MSMQSKERISKIFANLKNVDTRSLEVDDIPEGNYSIDTNGSLTLESIIDCTKTQETKVDFGIIEGRPKDFIITSNKELLYQPENNTLHSYLERDTDDDYAFELITVQAEIHEKPFDLARKPSNSELRIINSNNNLDDIVTCNNTNIDLKLIHDADMPTIVEDIESAPGSPSIFNFVTDNNVSVKTITNEYVQEADASDDSDDGLSREQKKRKRKKRADKETWTKTKNMKNREEGKEYHSRSRDEGGWKYDVPKNKRIIKPRCNCKLSNKNTKLQCLQIDEKEREIIFEKFWKLTWKEKKIYIKTLVDVKPVARKRGSDGTSKRSNSLELYLDKPTCKVRVCKTMFLNTLSVGEWALKNWARNENQPENESTVNEKSKTNETKKEQVRHFLDLLPKLESHYCRKCSSKLYLEPVWESKAQLLRFYNDVFAKEKNFQSVSIATLAEVFEEMNLGLYQPKKDACDLCEKYKTKNLSEEVYKAHIEKKESARREKENDKISQKEVFTMDLQAVQLCPKSNVSSLYFKTKLAVHNFTGYDIKRSEGYCFLWNESEGGLTANEFASIIVRMLKLFMEKNNIQQGTEIVLFSDGCTYQNRNAVLSNALLNFAMLHQVTIVQKILEKGHTQMEADSMHSVIERKVRKRKINVPADYVQIAKTSCKKKPYYVDYLQHSFFKNFETGLAFYKSIRPGSKTGDPVVTDLRQLRYSPEGVIYYRLGFTEDYPELILKRRGKKIQPCRFEDLPPLYTERLKIKKSKFLHLQELKLTMESDFHAFYDSLPHEN